MIMMNFRQEIKDLVFARERTLGEIYADPFIQAVATLHETAEVLHELVASGALIKVGSAHYSTERGAVSAPFAEV